MEISIASFLEPCRLQGCLLLGESPPTQAQSKTTRYIVCATWNSTFFELVCRNLGDAIEQAMWLAINPDYANAAVWIEHELGDENPIIAVFQNSDEDEYE